MRGIVRHLACSIKLVELHEIGARLQARDRFRNREHSCLRRVGGSRRVDLAGPQLLGHVRDVRAVVHIAPAALAVRIALRDGLERQRAIGDARDRHLHLVDVHRLQCEAIGVDARQDHAVALEADVGGAVADRDRHIFIEGQRAAVRCGKARANLDAAIVAKFQAAEAEARAFDRQCDLRAVAHVHERTVIGRRVKAGREGQAGAWQVLGDVDRVADELELARTVRPSGVRLSGFELRTLVLAHHR